MSQDSSSACTAAAACVLGCQLALLLSAAARSTAGRSSASSKSSRAWASAGYQARPSALVMAGWQQGPSYMSAASIVSLQLHHGLADALSQLCASLSGRLLLCTWQLMPNRATGQHIVYSSAGQ